MIRRSRRRKQSESTLEARLRATRPQAPDELVARLSAKLAASRGGSRLLSPRVALAAALTLAAFTAFASVGGVRAAAAAAGGAASAVAKAAGGPPSPVPGTATTTTTTTTTTATTTTTTTASSPSAPAGGSGQSASAQSSSSSGGDKIYICHATNDPKKPYDKEKVDATTHDGHDAHPNDIIPEPEGGCPKSAKEDKNKIYICHATGSQTNPYVKIKVDENGLNGHGDHPGDIIPAPAGGCPKGGTPGEDQYKPGKGCGDKNHVHFKEGQCKDKDKVNDDDDDDDDDDD